VLATPEKRKTDSSEVTGRAEKKRKGDSLQAGTTQGEKSAKDIESISAKGKTVATPTKATEVAKTKAAEAAKEKAAKEVDMAKAPSWEAETSSAKKGKAPTTVLALRQQANDG
jgi:hypothetical protein